MNVDVLTNLQDEYKLACKDLTRRLKKSKRKEWRKKCSNLENDIWGAGTKIVRKYIGGCSCPFTLEDEQKMETVSHPFSRKENDWEKGETEIAITELTRKVFMESSAREKGKGKGRGSRQDTSGGYYTGRNSYSASIR